MASSNSSLKPIILYDHLPGILAGYPAFLFAILAILSVFTYPVIDETLVKQLDDTKAKYVDSKGADAGTVTALSTDPPYQLLNTREPWLNSHMLFWIGLSIMVVWYIAFRFNMPKSKFILMAALLGCFIGLPVLLELTTSFTVFSWLGSALGTLEPSVNTGTWIVMSLVFFIIWLCNFIYSLTHLKVQLDESGLTINRMGGKGERFELIGLKTENEPLDYLELFLAGVGSLTLKTRMGKPIFTMKRVMGLYRTLGGSRSPKASLLESKKCLVIKEKSFQLIAKMSPRWPIRKATMMSMQCLVAMMVARPPLKMMGKAFRSCRWHLK